MEVQHQILELFPTPIFTTMVPESYSKIIPWFFKQNIVENGVDSPNYGERSQNSYILDEPECLDIKKHILTITKQYGDMLGYDYNEYRFGQSWISYKYPNQHHTMHSHPNSLISGVFYFGEGDEKTPAIKFHKMVSGVNSSYISPKEVKDKREIKYSHKEFSIEFKAGLLVLFPSHLHHSVPINQSLKVRSSLAFNVVPTIGFGSEGNLTELKF